MKTITYYDFTNVEYSAIYLNGFAENASQRGFRFEVSHREPPEFSELDLTRKWLNRMNSYFMICRYEGEESFLFCIDSGAHNGDVAGEGFLMPILDKCRYYFKVNYNRQSIAENPDLAPYASKFRPVPIVFPIAVSQPWRYLPKIVPGGGSIWPHEAISFRSQTLFKSPSLDRYRRMRAVPKDIDAFFVTTLYSETRNPAHLEENERRRTLVEGLNRPSRFNILARYAVRAKDKRSHGPYEMERISLKHYLELMGRSRVGIYIRGVAGCLSFKFGELMALGLPIAGESILNNRENMYAFERFDEQFAYDDPQELVERVFYLLEHPELADELRQANITTFENHLTPRAVVAHIVDELEY